MTFRIIQSNPSLDSSLVHSLASFIPLNKYQTNFKKIASKWKMSQFWHLKITFRMIQPNPYFLQYIGPFRRKLHTKTKRFLRNKTFKWNGRTTDNSSLEKLRCLSAGGAKN